MTHVQAEAAAIAAAQTAIAAHYDAARAELSALGWFGKELDRKARKVALKKGGFGLPEGWTIAMVTPPNWGHGALGYRGQSALDMQP